MDPLFATIDSFHGNRQDTASMGYRPCPICNRDAPRAIVAWSDFQFFNDSQEVAKRANIHQVMCRRCHTLYMNPCYTPSGFGTLFSLAGMSYGASEMRKDEQLAWLDEHQLLRPGSTFMDVGCYLGEFLAVLPESIKGVGVDIDATIIQQAQAAKGREGMTFIAGDFETFEYQGPLDVITMFHVLEHVPHPVAVLKKLRALAQPHTRLVVEVPVLEKAKTNDINGYLTVSHLTHFSIRTLELCFQRAGWKLIARTSQKDYNGYRVLAEPGEQDESGKGSHGDLAVLYDYLKDWYTALGLAEAALGQVPCDKPCVIWGAGFHTELIYQLSSFFEHQPERSYLLVDSHQAKQGGSWRGIPIHGPEVLQQLTPNAYSLLISSYGGQESIAAAAKTSKVPEESVFRIYDRIRRY